MTFNGSAIDDVNAGGPGGDGSATYITGVNEPTTPNPGESPSKLGSGGSGNIISSPTVCGAGADFCDPDKIEINGNPFHGNGAGGAFSGAGAGLTPSRQNPNEDCFASNENQPIERA